MRQNSFLCLSLPLSRCWNFWNEKLEDITGQGRLNILEEKGGNWWGRFESRQEGMVSSTETESPGKGALFLRGIEEGGTVINHLRSRKETSLQLSSCRDFRLFFRYL